MDSPSISPSAIKGTAPGVGSSSPAKNDPLRTKTSIPNNSEHGPGRPIGTLKKRPSGVGILDRHERIKLIAQRLPTKLAGGRGCRCKATKCLKMYCECFSSQGFCSSQCKCTDCKNTTGFESDLLHAREAALVRNPTCFGED
mmetsp:Transcript_18087/g.37564  ORF Transcript_18087/g.37564 Transcript_18087/m.37564 type:complete len:142 (+) Transcript_18087:473-898(+)